MDKESIRFIAKGFIMSLLIIGATILAYNGKDGWGWLLFVALFF